MLHPFQRDRAMPALYGRRPCPLPAAQPRSGYATRAAGPPAAVPSPLSATGARRVPGSAAGGGPGFGWGTARGVNAQRDRSGAQEIRTDFSDLRRRLTGAYRSAFGTALLINGWQAYCVDTPYQDTHSPFLLALLRWLRPVIPYPALRPGNMPATSRSSLSADGFGRHGIERAESAEAESPPNTQLYALRSRGAAAANSTFGAAAAHLPAGPARAAVQHSTVSGGGGVVREGAAAVSDAMDLSESQGPIKTRLKVPSQGVTLAVLHPGPDPDPGRCADPDPDPDPDFDLDPDLTLTLTLTLSSNRVSPVPVHSLGEDVAVSSIQLRPLHYAGRGEGGRQGRGGGRRRDGAGGGVGAHGRGVPDGRHADDRRHRHGDALRRLSAAQRGQVRRGVRHASCFVAGV